MVKFPTKTKGTQVAIAPSILSADQFRLGQQIKEVERAGADWLHVDIMDGHFVPNLSFGPATVKAIDGKTSLAQDVHLMVLKPEDFINPFIKAGASGLTLHIESQGDLKTLLAGIKERGLSAGISIKPDTDTQALKPFLALVDLVLVMTVYPGFGGRGFLEDGPKQISNVRNLINDSGGNIWLEVDGGINKDTASLAVKAGADALVAGAAVFCQPDAGKALKDIRESIILV